MFDTEMLKYTRKEMVLRTFEVRNRAVLDVRPGLKEDSDAEREQFDQALI